MARVPEVIRRQAVSQVAAQPVQAGAGWAALSELARVGAEFVKPAAEKQAREEGFDAVYRDENGKLQVAERSVLGGEFSDIHNAAAFSKYLAQRSLDMGDTFAELARNNEFNPAGFKAAADGYQEMLEEDETVPRTIKEDLLVKAAEEASRQFNGLQNAATQRTQRESDTATKALLVRQITDYTSLIAAGETEEAEKKMAEIEGMYDFRVNAPYINETPETKDLAISLAKGDAQAARLHRLVTDNAGSTKLPEQVRSELDAALENPNLSPEDRAKFHAITKGLYLQVDAAALTQSLSDGSYAAKVRRAESGGQLDAANPNSTALGPHQFIKSTWNKIVGDLRKKGGAAWAEGLSDDEILAMRTNADASDEVFAEFRAQNAGALQNAGIPINDANEYLAHFLGVGGAIKVLTADPSVSIADILPAGVIKANPHLEGMTAADISNWAARKMVVKASDVAMQMNVIDQLENLELRSAAAGMLTDQINILKRNEMNAALEYQTRFSTGDTSLTEDGIRGDHRLSDSMQNTLTEELRKNNKIKVDLQNTLTNLQNPDAVWDIYDTKERNSVNSVYESSLGDQSPLSVSGVSAASEIATVTGYVPKAFANSVRGAIDGDDPEALASAMVAADQIQQRQQGAFKVHPGSEALMSALDDYRHYSDGRAPVDAATKMIEDRSPDAVARRKNLSDAAKEATKSLEATDLVKFMSNQGLDVNLGSDEFNASISGSIMAEYSRRFEDAYIETGNFDLAKNRALRQMSENWGPDEVTGSEQIMKFPPQNYYNTHVFTPDMMSEQLVAEVTAFAFADEGDDRPVGPRAGAPRKKSIPPGNIRLISDERTRREVSERLNGRKLPSGTPVHPSYRIMFLKDGEWQTLPGSRFHFDDAVAMQQNQADLMEQRSEAEKRREMDKAASNRRAWLENLRAVEGLSVSQARQRVRENWDEYGAMRPGGN